MMKFAMSGWTERQRIAALTITLIISLLKQYTWKNRNKLICQFKLIN